MKESTWNECIDSHSAREITPDEGKASSITDTAQGRKEFLEKISVIESNANYIFEGYYSCVLELIHAKVLVEGYKVTNHICLGFYIRDVLQKEEWFRIFDDCRYKRNSLLYYGRKMDFETAKDSIEKCKKLLNILFI